jgi:hypothetical protein
MNYGCWASVAATRGVPFVTFGADLRAGGQGYAFNARWFVLQDAANDNGPSAA